MNVWSSLWQLIRFQPWRYLIDALLWVGFYVLLVIPGLIARTFFDLLTGQAEVSIGLWGLISLLVASQVTRTIIVFPSAAVDVTFRMNNAALLHKNLLTWILERPGARAIPSSPGEAISRLRDDVDEIGMFIGRPLFLDFLGAAIFASISLMIMLTINTMITLVVFVPLVGIVAAAHIASTRLQHYRRASRQATGNVTGFIGEIFGAIQAVKVAHATQPVIARFRELNEERRKSTLQDRLFSEVLSSIFRNTTTLGTGLILLLASQAIQHGTFTIGDFALFVYNLQWITLFMDTFGRVLANYQQVGVSFTRLATLMEGTQPESLIKHGPIHLHGPLPDLPVPQDVDRDRLEVLHVSNLTYRYPETERGIHNVSLDLQRGTFTVITGRIGSGKTTLLRALLGLVPKETGTICWNGRVLDQPARWFVPPHSAYTPQMPHLFSETVKQNILQGLPEAGVDLLGAIHMAVLEADLEAMDEGLDTLVGPRGVRLSGGQAQCTAAARMFVRNPELLVCDDLSSALDVETERLLWQRVFARRDVTCLVVSHRHAALQRADHIIVLRDGQIEAEGKLEHVLMTSPELQRLWHHERNDSQT
ncbi:MAG: ABC transporter ATP-binding protein [Herpetosiphon sp.]